MKQSTSSKATVIRSTTTLEIDDGDILQWLRMKGELPAGATAISVTWRVPTGGDYSGCQVEVSECPVIVRFTVEETRNGS